MTQISPLTVGVLHPRPPPPQRSEICVCGDQAEIEPTLSSQIYIENDFQKNIVGADTLTAGLAEN